MNKISIKQLELAGAGVIRNELISQTFRGNIYNATVYYSDNKFTSVRVLYYKNGDSKLLGPSNTTADSIEEFKEMMLDLLPNIPLPDKKNIRIITTGIVAATAFTLLNIATTVTLMDIIIDIVDMAIISILTALYRAESKRYVKKSWK